MRSIVRRFRALARITAEREILPAWAASVTAGHTAEAAEELITVRAIGQALSYLGGDPLLADAVADVERCSPKASWSGFVHRVAPAAAGRLRNGLSAYGEAERFRSKDLRRARLLLCQAARQLDTTAKPLALLATVGLAASQSLSSSPTVALETIERARRDPAFRRYPTLAARAAWIEGLTRGILGDASGSISAFDFARRAFLRAGEEDQAGAVASRLAEQYRVLGSLHEAWRAALEALATATPQQARQALPEAAEVAIRLGCPTVAVRFQDLWVAAAQGNGDPTMQAFALLERSLLRWRSGRTDLAASDLDAAARAWSGIADPAVRFRITAELLRVKAALVLPTDPRRAVSILTKAIALYRKLHLEVFLHPLYLARARAVIALRDPGLESEQAIAADLGASLASIERRRGYVPGDELRISFQDGVEETYEEAVRFELQRGRQEAAFDLTERARARVLLDRFSTVPPSDHLRPPGAALQPLSSQEVQRALPEDIVLIAYTSLPEKLLVWVVSRQGISQFTTRLSRQELADQVASLRGALAEDATNRTSAAVSIPLWQALLSPALTATPRRASLVIVPGGPLTGLPFGALVDPATGHYLIDERTLSYAPSASLFVAGRLRDRELARRGGGHLLAVGDPAFDEESFADLSRLPGAAAEVREIAALYPGATVLLDKVATKGRLTAEAGSATILHFSGHAWVDPEAPMLSRLLLAGTGSASTLTAQEIEEVPFRKTRLVVLATCESALGKASASEGILSLARSFLAARVPTVVATSWRIDDRAAAVLFPAFYRHLRRGLPAAEALGSAQRELLHHPDPNLRRPAAWAAAEVFGGDPSSR
ncbi:MAG: CHAT domain-containing protein [Acidobacteriota bacterium]|nr:CHAT domain-containing protein [Acidobacteriota bacterium]